MNKNKELLRRIIREAIQEVEDESYERDEAQELNLMKQIQAAAHWLDAHKGANPRDVAQAVTFIKSRIDELIAAHEKGKEVPTGTAESPLADYKEEGKVSEVAPPGWEGTVKAMKKHKKDIDNPWALSYWMKNKGYKSHK